MTQYRKALSRITSTLHHEIIDLLERQNHTNPQWGSRAQALPWMEHPSTWNPVQLFTEALSHVWWLICQTASIPISLHSDPWEILKLTRLRAGPTLVIVFSLQPFYPGKSAAELRLHVHLIFGSGHFLSKLFIVYSLFFLCHSYCSVFAPYCTSPFLQICRSIDPLEGANHH